MSRRIYWIVIQGVLTSLLGAFLVFWVEPSSVIRFLGALNILLGGMLLGFAWALRALYAAK